MTYKVVLRFLLCLSVTHTISCGHFAVSAKKPTSDMGIKYQDLEKAESFGFFHGNDEYYFAKTHIKNEGYHCWFFVGFKNDKFEYSFPTDRLMNLKEVYFQNLGIEKKRIESSQRLHNLKKKIDFAHLKQAPDKLI